jgi:hypothetical protein
MTQTIAADCVLVVLHPYGSLGIARTISRWL